MDQKEFAKRGGRAKFAKVGKKGMSEMGKKGQAGLKKYGPDYYKRIRKGEKPSQD
jgi:hypothetical protein